MKKFVTGLSAFALPVLIIMTVPAAEAAKTVERLTSARNETYGNYVADAGGRAVYMFTPDRRGEGEAAARSTCYGACAQAWPPVLAKDLPGLGAGLDKALLGASRRKDGSLQVTYGGWPLYYYVRDRPGSLAGQDVHSFGGGWYLVAPDGSVIGEERD